MRLPAAPLPHASRRRNLCALAPLPRSQETVAGVMLHGAPRHGAAGAVVDALRVLLGCRLLSNALITLLFPLPLPLAAAVHAAVVALTVNSNGYCDTPVGARLRWKAQAEGRPAQQLTPCLHPSLVQLLAHPTMQRRLGRLSWLLHTSTILSTPMGSSIARQPPEYACTDVLRWLVLLFTALPVVLLAWREADAEVPEVAAQTLQRRGAPATAAGGQPQPDGAASSAKRALRLAHSGLRAACFCGLGRFARCAALAWMASVLWLVGTI